MRKIRPAVDRVRAGVSGVMETFFLRSNHALGNEDPKQQVVSLGAARQSGGSTAQSVLAQLREGAGGEEVRREGRSGVPWRDLKTMQGGSALCRGQGAMQGHQQE